MKKMYYSRLAVILLIICNVAFLFQIYRDDVLTLYMKLIAFGAIIILTLIIIRVSSSKSKLSRFIAGMLAILLGTSQLIGMNYISGIHSFLSQISFLNDSVKINVYVRKNSHLNLNELKDKKVGIVASKDIGYYHNVNFDLNATFENGSNYTNLFKELELGKVDAVMVLQSNLKQVTSEYPTLETNTKLLATLSSGDAYANLRAGNINEDPYTIYISGIDQFGDVPDYGLSDVNMLLTINPKSNKILMTTIPRDTLVKNGCSNTTLPDKLTHIGNAGVACSMKSISNLLNVKINYFVKINFTSVVDIVDALGGISVNSEYSFNSFDMKEEEYHFVFKEGVNQLNGKQALVFARIRNAFEDGDIQRGKNQHAVLKGLISKMKSPAILLNYDKVLTSISKNVKTSFSVDELKAVLKHQLEKNPEWIIESQSIVGENVAVLTESYPDTYLSAMEADETSIKAAIQKINLYLK